MLGCDSVFLDSHTNWILRWLRSCVELIGTLLRVPMVRWLSRSSHTVGIMAISRGQWNFLWGTPGGVVGRVEWLYLRASN